MKAIRIHEFGDAGSLLYEEVPMPAPAAGHVRIGVRAIGLNFVEIYQRSGIYRRELPFIPGGECSGVVDAVGDGVSDFRPGDRVVTDNAAGAYADYAVAAADSLLRLPGEISFESGAALILQGMTAHYLACSTFPLKIGDAALIHAAAGGVGLLLVQIAKRRGARIIATVSTEEKAQAAREAGADEIVLYQDEDFVAATKRFTAGKGVDVVYDSVGKTTFDKSLDCLRPRGYLVLFGQSSGKVPPIDPQILNSKGSLFLTRPTLGHYRLTRDELEWRANELFQWVARNELSVRIGKTFALRDAADAQRYMEARMTIGKVLLTP